MSTPAATPQKESWLKITGKSLAASASTGAALISVFTALYSHGLVGKADAHQSIGNLGAAWVGLQPTLATATAIGDTTHFVATIADRRGSILVGARPTWTTGDTTVAMVRQDGAVIARGAGATLVTVVVGELVASARIRVRQSPATLRIGGATRDSGVVVGEGSRIRLAADVLDARGFAIAGARVAWAVDDTGVALVDSGGTATGQSAGRTVLIASIDELVARSALTVPTTAAAMELVAGADQRALAGSALPQPVVVRATTRRGAPAAGQLVRFRLTSTLGAVQPESTYTDADGRARATWTLGELPGRQSLLATSATVDSALTIGAEADPVAANTRVVVLRDSLAGAVGQELAEPVAVRVTDSAGRAVPEVPVRWIALDGGTIGAVSARTDSAGVARARWTLATKAGPQRVRVQVGSAGARVAPVTITAGALAGAPVGVVVVGGDRQRGRAGGALAKPLVLRVIDTHGNGVAGAEVLLSPSGGAVPDSAPRTDAHGIVRTPWTLGREARSYSLGVHFAGATRLVRLSAAAAPAAPANLTFDDAPGPSKSATVKRLHALVTDVHGNPVPDAALSLSTRSGVVSPRRAVTDATGRAALAWTLGTTPGAQTLTGTVTGRDVTGNYVTLVGALTRRTPKTPPLTTKKPRRR